MEFSFYDWLWMILGAVFLPLEVTAYIVSIVKVVLDRYRIKKTNTARRQSKLTGVPSGKRINIIIIKDEERVFRIMSNGNCLANHKKSIGCPADTSSNGEDSTESDQHKQNGGHSLQVTVEYNLEVQSISGDLALLQHGQVLKENSFKKITASKRSITIDGDNVANYASFYDSNAKIGVVANSGSTLAEADKIVSSSSISLPDLNSDKQTKQPPPKPKRNPCPVNKKAHIIETEKKSYIHVPVIEAEVRLSKDISGINECQDSTTSKDNKKNHLSADHAPGSRRYSATSATDTDDEVIQSLPNRSRSEDCLLGSSQEVHLTKSSSQGDVNTGHANVAFTDSSEEMKTNL